VSAVADIGIEAVSTAADARSVILIFMSLSLVADLDPVGFRPRPPRDRKYCCTEALVPSKNMMSQIELDV
jgi:hypothetical protein